MNLIESLLDRMTEDILQKNPEKSEFEAAFIALRANLTGLTYTMTEIGKYGQGLNDKTLFGICSGLTETCLWMASKEGAADTLRDIAELGEGE